MFPRTRRCLTGTYPRPIVTARTSRSPRTFEASGETREHSSAAQQEVQTPENAESPSDGTVKVSHYVPTGARGGSRRHSPTAPHDVQLSQNAAIQSPDSIVKISRYVPKKARGLKIWRYHTDNTIRALNTTRDWKNEVMSDTIRYQTARTLVDELINDRLRHLPRSDPSAAFPVPENAEQEFVPTFVTARKHLGAVRKTQHDSAEETEAASSKAQPYAEARVDGLSLAKFIAKIPRSSKPKDTAVELNRKFVQTYTGSSNSNAWNEPIGAGVHVQLLPPTNHVKGRLAILTGSEYYKNLVLNKLTGDNYARNNQQSQSSADPDDLSSVNSPAAFTRFVERLTNPFHHRRLERWLYGDYHKYAADLLRWMFVNPRVSQYASTAALIQALTFLHRHLDLLRHADVLYSSGRRKMLIQNVAVMNVRLKFALRHSLGPIAHTTARDMMQFNIQPNSTTWAIIYAALRTPDERRKLLRIIQNHDVHIDQRGWSRLASATLIRALKRDGDDIEKLTSTIRGLDDALGPSWLDGQAINQVLRLCARQDLYGVAEELSALAKTRNIDLPKSANVHLFGLLRGRKDFKETIDLLIDTGSKDDDLYHKWIIPYAFRVAWLRFRPNTCHLLWIYAASRGFFTRGMYKMVTKALLFNPSADGEVNQMSPSQLRRMAWKRMAARIISGFDEDAIRVGTDSGDRFPRLRAYVSKLRGKADKPGIAEMLTIWTPDDGTRDEQITLAHVMIGHDLDAWKTFDGMPIDVLTQQLRLAAERDQRLSSATALDEFISQDTHEARQESMIALRGCILRRADGELSARVRRERDVILRNLETADLKPNVHIEPDLSEAPQEAEAGDLCPTDSPYE